MGAVSRRSDYDSITGSTGNGATVLHMAVNNCGNIAIIEARCVPGLGLGE